MKINQFAHTPANFETKLEELSKLRFIKAGAQQEDLNLLWKNLLLKCFPQAKCLAQKHEKLASLAATKTESVPEFIEKKTVDLTVFYAVAMQLLQFEPDTEFDIDNPLKSMDELGVFHADKLEDSTDMISAFYDLLATHGKNGQTLLDHLGNLGFFVDFYDLPVSEKPVFFNGKAQPVFDTTKLIFEVVYVESDLDTDHDGKADLLKAEISYQGNKKSLTKNELGILRLLMVNKGNIIPRDAIIDELWQSEQFIDENTLNVNIVRLRKALTEIGLPDYLETKRGLGYCV